MLRKIAFSLALILLSAPAWAQMNLPHRLALEFGGGVTPTVGTLDQRLDTGWNFLAGAGYNANKHVAIMGEYQYDWLGIARHVLNQLAVPDGEAHIWSLTVDPMFKINPDGRFGAHIIGGGGFYRRTILFTQPTLEPVTVFDPFFGLFENAFIPANQVIGRFSQNVGGVNVGGGLDFKLGQTGTTLFTEARYHWIGTSRHATEIFPVTFGIRF